MALINSDDIVYVVTTQWPSGKTTTSSGIVASFVDQADTKVKNLKPVFVPGVFLIKPYSVSSRRVDPERTERTSGVFTRSDGVKFSAKFTGKLNGRNFSLTALPWGIVNQSQLRAYCVHNALSKVNEAVWDSMIDLAELASTYRLLRSPTDGLADKLVDGVKSATKAAKKDIPHLVGLLGSMVDGTFSGTRYAKSFAGNKKSWGNADGKRPRDGFTKRDIKAYNDVVDYLNKKLLEYRYGWLPAYLSLQDALEALQASLLKATKQIKTARSRKKKEESTSKSGTYTNQYTEVRTDYEYRVEGIAYYRRTLDQRMIDMIGLKPENLPRTAWELTKLSFVWDWFLAVGTWLDAMKPEYGVEILGVSDSQKTKITNTWSCQWGAGQAPSVRTQPDTAVHSAFERNIGDIQMLPAMTGTDRMTPIRWADAAALSFKPLRRLAALLSKKV